MLVNENRLSWPMPAPASTWPARWSSTFLVAVPMPCRAMCRPAPEWPEPIHWLDDGTPYSPRFNDRYHSEQGAVLAQAREVFLQGCGLPEEWAGQPQ